MIPSTFGFHQAPVAPQSGCSHQWSRLDKPLDRLTTPGWRQNNLKIWMRRHPTCNERYSGIDWWGSLDPTTARETHPVNGVARTLRLEKVLPNGGLLLNEPPTNMHQDYPGSAGRPEMLKYQEKVHKSFCRSPAPNIWISSCPTDSTWLRTG